MNFFKCAIMSSFRKSGHILNGLWFFNGAVQPRQTYQYKKPSYVANISKLILQAFKSPWFLR